MSHKYTKEIAAAKSGMSAKTARNYLKSNILPNEVLKNRNWKTRTNVFEEDWVEIENMLSKSPKLQANTILEHLISRDSNKFNKSHERTLQRLIRNWRANKGTEKAIIFSQKLHPAMQSQSDYTVMNDLEITISWQQFDHMLFHFILPYSRWEYASICYSESFESLSKGYDEAVWFLGYVAPEHRTDNLTAATQVCGSKRVFTKNWKEVMNHYGVTPSRNNPGVSHENGSIEKSHDLLKNAIRQQLMLRGSNNFANIEDYQLFINKLVDSRNSRRMDKFEEETRLLKPLPSKKYYAPIVIESKVSQFSTIHIMKAIYSVPSRLIGYTLRAYIYRGEIKLYYGQTLVQTMPQIKDCKKGTSSINYSHIITSLLRKPGAFANYYYRDYLFPTTIFRNAYDILITTYPVNGTKQYLQILQLAAIGSQSEVETALELLLSSKISPSFEEIQALLKTSIRKVTGVKIMLPSLDDYDSLLTKVA